MTTVDTRIMGVAAALTYTLDAAEDVRRREAGGREILSPDVLELLLGLPEGMPVPVGALTARERFGLQEAPPWVVQVVAGHALRLAVVPLVVDLAVVQAKTWRTGLETAGRFTPFCARTMVLPEVPVDVDEMATEASFWGVGVVVQGDQLVAPVPFRRLRWTAAGRSFVERVYMDHLNTSG